MPGDGDGDGEEDGDGDGDDAVARRIQQRENAARESLMEQEKDHLASVQSYLDERERQINENSDNKKILVNRALEREKRLLTRHFGEEC